MKSVLISMLGDHIGEEVEITGWLFNIRSSGKIAFLQLRDGTGRVQGVAVEGEMDDEHFQKTSDLRMESSIRVTGVVREDDRAPTGFELTLTGIYPVQVPDEDYPISKQSHGQDFLLSNRHLWLRSHDQFHILKIRDEIEWAVNRFFRDNGFMRIDTPILTGSIGESGGSLFETEYFDLGSAFLAQTGQLYLEAAAAAFRNVYCFGPTFRAEKSKTRRHLTEFWMVEAEMAFCDSDSNMDVQEELVKAVLKHVLENCMYHFKELDRNTEPLEHAASDKPFARISYSDAVELLTKEGSDITWGDDFGGGDETIIAESFGRPVFVCDYPKSAKPFYMKESSGEEDTVLCDDLIAPEGYGEIIGASQRISDYERLEQRIHEEGLPADAYQWYLELRKYGTFEHSGFGMGLERVVSWVCGIPHVREAIPFPRMLKRLYP